MVASSVAFAGVLAWNVAGPGVRALLDAEADGTLCAIATIHLVATLVAASACAGALSWSLGPSRAGRLGALGVATALLGLAGLSLEADSISSLGSFASTSHCAAHEWRGPVLAAALAMFVAGVAWREHRPRRPRPPPEPGSHASSP